MNILKQKNEKLPVKTIIKRLRDSILMINKYRKGYIIAMILCAIILGIMPAVSTKVLQIIINYLQQGGARLSKYILLILLYILIDIILILVQAAENIYNSKFKMEFSNYLKFKMQSHAMDIPLKYYENNESYDLIRRAQDQNGGTIISFIDSIIFLFQILITLMSNIWIISGFHPEVIAIIFIIPLLRYIFSLYILKKKYQLTMIRTKDDRLAWYIEHLFLTGYAYKEIKLFSLKEFLLERYRNIKNNWIEKDMNIIKKSSKVQVILALIDECLSGGIFYFYIISGLKKVIFIGDVITYTKCIFSIKSNITNLLNNFSTIMENALYVDFLYQFFELSGDDTTDKEDNCEIDKIETIEFKHVTFKYPETKQYILRDLNLKLVKGKTLGIIGKNGTGKSTIIKILLGFYTDYEGEIYVNGINFRKLKEGDYYQKVSCLFQDFMKFEFSLRENIGFGCMDRIQMDKSIVSTLQKVGLDYLCATNEGIDLLLGIWFGKRQLSLGEWQRVSIGRAIFREADVYILDEADASLDVESEAKLIELYNEVFTNSIGIFVTHNIKAVRKVADEILVLTNDGEYEYGKHIELLKKRGEYYSLYNM